MRKRALCAGLLTSAVVLVGAPSAFAATATFVGGTLTVVGDASAETFTVAPSGTNVLVTSTVAVTAPVGCTQPTANSIACPDATTNTVIINAGTGADTLSFAGGTINANVQLNGEGDGDTLTSNDQSSFFSGSFVSLAGGDGNDTLNAGTGTLSFGDTGGPGNDIFNGSAQFSDQFTAEIGSDTYNGGTRVPAANETVGDAATYQLFNAQDSMSYFGRTDAVGVSLDGVANDGGAGENDNVAADVESVDGGSAADTLLAGANAARLDGNDGADVITGGPSDDQLNGGGASDGISGGAGDDTLTDGDSTPDIINPGDPALPAAGNDVLDGGPGNDNLNTDRGADNMIGGTGEDSASFAIFGDRPIPQTSAAAATTPQAFNGFTVTLDDVANDGPTGAAEGDNVHSDVEEVSTGSGADSITGSAAANTIFSGAGNDSIDPGAGADSVFAGLGDDVVSAVDQTTDNIDCGKGTDAAAVDLAGAQPTRADVTIDCESISGQSFGPVVTPTPPIDVSKIVLRLSSKTVKAKTFRKNGQLPVKVTCSKPCSLTGEAFTTKASIRIVTKVGQFKVGSAHLNLGAGTRTLKVKIAKKYLSRYKRQLRTKKQIKKGLSFVVGVTASDALGIQVSAKRTIKVKG